MPTRPSTSPSGRKHAGTRRWHSTSLALSMPTYSPDALPAEAHYQQALALAEALAMRPLQAHCHLGLGRLYGQIGRREEARVTLSTAIDFYRAMAMTFWLPQAEAALAQVEGR